MYILWHDGLCTPYSPRHNGHYWRCPIWGSGAGCGTGHVLHPLCGWPWWLRIRWVTPPVAFRHTNCAWLGWECSWGGICGVGSEGTCVLQARHGFSCWDLCTACCPVSTGTFKIFADVRIEDIWKNLVDLCIRDCIQSCSSFIASQQGMTIECPSCLSWLRHMKASHIVTNTANTVIKFVWIA